MCCFILLFINKGFGGTGNQSWLFTETQAFGGFVPAGSTLSLAGFVRCPRGPGRQDGASRAPGRAERLWGSAGGCEQCLSSSAQSPGSPRALSGWDCWERAGAESWGPLPAAVGLLVCVCVNTMNLLFVGLCSALAEHQILGDLFWWVTVQAASGFLRTKRTVLLALEAAEAQHCALSLFAS